MLLTYCCVLGALGTVHIYRGAPRSPGPPLSAPGTKSHPSCSSDTMSKPTTPVTKTPYIGMKKGLWGGDLAQ